MDCLFCRIINKEMPAGIVYEDEKFITLQDIEPKAPIHLLIIPKKHIPSVDHLVPEDRELIGEMVLVAQKIAKEKGVSQTGYRLSLNVGQDAGQTINHLHLHLMGGKTLKL